MRNHSIACPFAAPHSAQLLLGTMGMARAHKFIRQKLGVAVLCGSVPRITQRALRGAVKKGTLPRKHRFTSIGAVVDVSALVCKVLRKKPQATTSGKDDVCSSVQALYLAARQSVVERGGAVPAGPLTREY